MSEGNKAVEEVKKFVDKHSKCPKCKRRYGEFAISRLPPKTKAQFLELAKEDFCDDFGMTLKFLVDIYCGIIPTGNELAELANAKAEEALTQLAELKGMVETKPDEKKTIRMCDGKEKVI